MVYVGGNDGMLHAFYAETDLTKTVGNNNALKAAREAWAFVPTAVMSKMPALASVNYDNGHQYFVDGSPVMADVYDKGEGKWKTILVGGFNKGGKGYYALDITDPEAPKALWQTSDTSMGYSYGKPLVTKLPDGTWAVMLTSGYNNSSNRGYVYVLNALKGTFIQTMVNPSGSGMKDLNNFVKDPVGDNTTELFYGGDIEGNIWRYKWNGSSYTGAKVVQLLGSDGSPQPITTRLELVQGQGGSSLPRILVATGKMYGFSDMTTTKPQTIYGFDDKLEGYNSSSFRGQLKESKLTNVTGASGQATRTLQCLDSAAVCNDGAKGWFVELPDTGERVNVDLRLAGSTLVVASNVPSDQPCSAGGHAWINYLDFQTGLAVNVGSDGKGQAAEQVLGIVMGSDLTANKDGKVTDHVSPGRVPDKPLDIDIPTATPKPKGKRISWREVVQ